MTKNAYKVLSLLLLWLLPALLLFPALAQAYPTVPDCNGSSSNNGTSYELVWGTRTHLWSMHDYVYCDYFRFIGTASFSLNKRPLIYCTEDTTTKSCCNGPLCGTTTVPCAGEVLVMDCHFTAEVKPSFLKVGENIIDFSTTYLASAIYSYMDEEQILTLFGPNKFERELYRATWSQPQTVSVSLTLTWEDLNVELGKKIKALLAKLDLYKDTLWKNAFDSYFTLNRAWMIDELTKKLREWLTQGIDQLNSKGLYDLATGYETFYDITKELASLVDDLNANLVQLKKDLDGLTKQFGERTNLITSGVIDAATGYGYNPVESNNYVQESSATDQTEVNVPEVSPEDPLPFDADNNQYDRDASIFIAEITKLTNGGTVTDRGSFIRLVLAWKENQEAIKYSLQERAYASANEYAAFLNAQQRVFNFLANYLDESMWFRDSPIPIAIRQIVDDWGWGGDEDQKPWPYFLNARYLKYGFETWYNEQLTPAQLLFLNMLPGTKDYVQAVAFMVKASEEGLDEVLAASDDVMQNLVYAGLRVGVGFIPVVGTLLDFCELVTGTEFCMPGGRELSAFERSMAGVGLLAGNGALWRTLGTVGKTTVKVAAVEAKITVTAFLASGRSLPLLRHQYVMAVYNIKNEVWAMRLAGNTPEQIARMASARRREISSMIKGMTPQPVLESIFARNMSIYGGDKLGPTIEFLRSQGKTWEEIIESACHPGNKFLFY